MGKNSEKCYFCLLPFGKVFRRPRNSFNFFAIYTSLIMGKICDAVRMPSRAGLVGAVAEIDHTHFYSCQSFDTKATGYECQVKANYR